MVARSGVVSVSTVPLLPDTRFSPVSKSSLKTTDPSGDGLAVVTDLVACLLQQNAGVGCTVQALIDVTRQAATQDEMGRSRQIRRQRIPVGVALDHAGQDLGNVLTGKSLLSCQHLVGPGSSATRARLEYADHKLPRLLAVTLGRRIERAQA
jgi:hypothetical protein